MLWEEISAPRAKEKSVDRIDYRLYQVYTHIRTHETTGSKLMLAIAFAFVLLILLPPCTALHLH